MVPVSLTQDPILKLTVVPGPVRRTRFSRSSAGWTTNIRPHTLADEIAPCVSGRRFARLDSEGVDAGRGPIVQLLLEQAGVFSLQKTSFKAARTPVSHSTSHESIKGFQKKR